MAGETFLQGIHLLIALVSLMQNHVDDFVMLGNVFCGPGHDLVDSLTEQLGVPTRICAYPEYKFSIRAFVLARRQTCSIRDRA